MKEGYGMLSYTNGEKYEVPDLELNSSTKFCFSDKANSASFLLYDTSYFDNNILFRL